MWKKKKSIEVNLDKIVDEKSMILWIQNILRSDDERFMTRRCRKDTQGSIG